MGNSKYFRLVFNGLSVKIVFGVGSTGGLRGMAYNGPAIKGVCVAE